MVKRCVSRRWIRLRSLMYTAAFLGVLATDAFAESVEPVVFGAKSGFFEAKIDGVRFEIRSSQEAISLHVAGDGTSSTTSFEADDGGFTYTVARGDAKVTVEGLFLEERSKARLRFTLDGETEIFEGVATKMLNLAATYRAEDRPQVPEVKLLFETFGSNAKMHRAFETSMPGFFGAIDPATGLACGSCCFLCAAFLIANPPPDPGDLLTCGWCWRCSPPILN